MGVKRKSLSKKIRFEVFKRDKFQCQYCGRSAPDVILNVDHIDPVANKGPNDIINLITSCFDCNQGKKARLLSDDAVVKKQYGQLALIQEKREQLEMMFEWRESLAHFENDKIKKISDYWGVAVTPHELSNEGSHLLKKLMKKFSIEQILEAIDIAVEKYIRFNEDGEVTKESVEIAFNKVGGICHLKKRPLLEQKMAYVRGICRNNFNYWDDKKGAIILNNFVNVFKKNSTDKYIIDFFDKIIIPRTKEKKTWLEWKNWLEKYIKGRTVESFHDEVQKNILFIKEKFKNDPDYFADTEDFLDIFIEALYDGYFTKDEIIDFQNKYMIEHIESEDFNGDICELIEVGYEKASWISIRKIIKFYCNKFTDADLIELESMLLCSYGYDHNMEYYSWILHVKELIDVSDNFKDLKEEILESTNWSY